MSTTTTAKPKRYDMPVTIRIPEAVRRGVRKLALDTGDTVTGVILGHLRPFELYASELGQDVLRRLEEAVARSTAIHRGAPPYLDKRGRPAHPPVEAWHGTGLELRNYGTSEKPLWLHKVKQREGQTRAEAVKAYALDLWREWSFLDGEEDREAYVKSLESDAHVFVMGFVGFEMWRRFPSSYEAELHRSLVTRGVEPSTPEEVRLYTWSVEWLTELWERATTEPGFSEVVLKRCTDEGFSLTLRLVKYPDCTVEEDIQRWARNIIDYARATEPSAGDFDTLRERVEGLGYKVVMVTIDK
jgi:hypothetical protein